MIMERQTFFFLCGAAAQRGPLPPHSWGFWITHSDASQSVGLLWMSDHFVAETSTWKNTTLTTNKHPCPDGIRTHELSRRTAEDLRLRPRGCWGRRRDRHDGRKLRKKLNFVFFSSSPGLTWLFPDRPNFVFGRSAYEVVDVLDFGSFRPTNTFIKRHWNKFYYKLRLPKYIDDSLRFTALKWNN